MTLSSNADHFIRILMGPQMHARLNLLAGSIQTVLAMIASYLPIGRVRIALLRALGAHIGPATAIAHGLQIRVCHRVRIGRDVFVSENVLLDGRGGLDIGDSTSIGSRVQVWTAQHDWRSRTFAYVSADVRIGHHVWLGPGVTILPGVHVADGCVIGAGAVVTKSTEPYGLYVGVPARRLADRPEPLGYELDAAKAKMFLW